MISVAIVVHVLRFAEFHSLLLMTPHLQEHEPNQEVVQLLAQELYSNDVIPLLVSELSNIEFEVGVECAFHPLACLLCVVGEKGRGTNIQQPLRKQSGGRCPAAEFIARHPEVLETLIQG